MNDINIKQREGWGPVSSILFVCLFLLLDLNNVIDLEKNAQLITDHGNTSAKWTSLMMGSSVFSFDWGRDFLIEIIYLSIYTHILLL